MENNMHVAVGYDPYATHLYIEASEPSASRTIFTQWAIEERILRRYPPRPEVDPYTLLSQAQRDWLEELLPPRPTASEKGKEVAAKDAPEGEGTQTAPSASTTTTTKIDVEDKNRPAQQSPQPSSGGGGGFASTQQERSMFIWSEFIRTGGPNFPLPHEPAFCTAGGAFYSYQES